MTEALTGLISKRNIIALFFCLICGYSHGQVGGRRSFEFLNIPGNALLSGVGGVNVSLVGQDVNLFLSNPALSSDTLSGYASAGFADYLADVNMATFSYTHAATKYGLFSLGIQHLSLGEVAGFDDLGVETNDVKSGEFAITIGNSHQVKNFRLGANLRFVASNIAGFRASGLMVDLGGTFIHPTKLLSVGIVFKNIGVVLTDYTNTADSRLPFDLQAGISIKPKHMPFRFSLTGYNLARQDITYFDPNGTFPDNNEEDGGVDKIFRHLVFGTELLISKNFNLRAGYNHLIRKELRLEETSGGAGLSFGLMFRVKSFEFAYSRGGYSAAGGLNSFTVISNLNRILKKIEKTK